MARKRCYQGLFELYDKTNPRVYELFKQFAEEAMASGSRIGSKAIYERIRWEIAVKTKREPGMPLLKLNNNYTAYYARKLLDENPGVWGHFFEFRKCEGDSASTGPQAQGWAGVS
ncbi:MAG: hypothetical protein ABL955_14570 [Elusimicrobiota bacterium]